jgi:hypothetical protein
MNATNASNDKTYKLYLYSLWPDFMLIIINLEACTSYKGYSRKYFVNEGHEVHLNIYLSLNLCQDAISECEPALPRLVCQKIAF